MIVIDASATGLLFLDAVVEPRAARARSVLTADPAWLVPEHWRVEVFATLRGLHLGGKLAHADRAVESLAKMTVAVADTQPLLPRMWELRRAISGYDAAYVAAAERHGCVLVTADARLVRAGVARCPIELIA